MNTVKASGVGIQAGIVPPAHHARSILCHARPGTWRLPGLRTRMAKEHLAWGGGGGEYTFPNLKIEMQT